MWKSGPKPTLEDWWKVYIDLSLDANTNQKKALTTFLGNWPKRDELISMPYATALPLSNLFLRLFFFSFCADLAWHTAWVDLRDFFFFFQGALGHESGTHYPTWRASYPSIPSDIPGLASTYPDLEHPDNGSMTDDHWCPSPHHSHRSTSAQAL